MDFTGAVMLKLAGMAFPKGRVDAPITESRRGTGLLEDDKKVA
jgi:hypothetical protein